MGKKLTTRESTDVALSKSKSFMGIIKNIFNNKVVPEDDAWVQRLWNWADENSIPNYEWIENTNIKQGGYWVGLSRDKEQLLISEDLVLLEKELWEIPKEIGNLENLTSVYLSKNYLTEIPSEIGNLINLIQLELSDNRLERLPKELCALINLEALYLYGNLLEEIPKEIGDLANLKLLGLSENKLTKLPKEIGNLVYLERLFVEECPLTELPKEIGELINLRQLALAGSNLIHLPKEIGSLISLDELRLTHNNLKEMPKEIGNLTNLEKLYLADNKLSHLPKEIGNLNNLKELVLAENNLFYLPKEIGSLMGLVELHLADNELTELPADICLLKNLKILQMGDNPLTFTNEQKEWIRDLIDNNCDVYFDDDAWERNIHTKKNDKSSLNSYFNHVPSGNIANNKVAEEDDSWMQRLWDWTDKNEIGWFEDDDHWSGLPRNKHELLDMVDLYLEEYKLTELPKEIRHLTNLTGLYLGDNDLTKLPKEIVELGNLTDLNLSWNNFTELPEEIIQLTKLRGLNFWENRLSALPKEIGQLSNLTMLILGDNELTKLPKEIGQLTNLTMLILCLNELTKLPKEIGQLSNVTELNLEENNLAELPDEITNLTNLSKLHINGNPNLVFTQNQIKWIEELKASGCDIHLDADVLEEMKSIENLEKAEEENTFTFDNGQLVVGIPGRKSFIIESLHAIIHNFSDKKLCIQKQFNKIKNEETDIYYSIIGQKHLDYSGSKFNVKDANNIYENEGSFGVCNSGIKVKPSSYIEWRFDFYQNDIYLEATLFKNNTKRKLYSRTLKNGPSELLDIYEMYIENGYKEALNSMGEHKNNLLFKASKKEKLQPHMGEVALRMVNQKIHSRKVALQFVLEELDAARNGNEYAVEFVKNSGFEPSEYIGAMQNSFDEVDGLDGPQMTLHAIGSSIDNIDMKVELIIKVVDRVMQKYTLGKYSEIKGTIFHER